MSSIPFEQQPSAAVVQITLGQVFNEVRQVHDEIKGLAGKLEPMRDQLHDHENRLRAVDPLPKRVDDVEEDLNAVRKLVDGLRVRSAMIAGGAAVLGAGAGSIVTLLVAHR